jgi:hypothetical protein
MAKWNFNVSTFRSDGLGICANCEASVEVPSPNSLGDAGKVTEVVRATDIPGLIS